MSRPLIGHKNSWATFEKCALEIFILALKMMRSKTNLPIIEDCVNNDDNLNRRLSFCLLEAIVEWEKINNHDIVTTPKANLGKQPDLDNEEVVNDYERTKPDFQWEFRDRLGNQLSHNSSFRNYDIECKRLGDLASSKRLNKEYVSKGIFRFTISTHRYGQFTESGAMIGYIQNSEPQTILNEVNQITLSKTLPELSLSSEGWQLEVSRLDHRLDRSDVEPTSFELRHLWVDLRHHYTQQSSLPEKKPSIRKSVAGRKIKPSSEAQ